MIRAFFFPCYFLCFRILFYVIIMIVMKSNNFPQCMPPCITTESMEMTNLKYTHTSLMTYFYSQQLVHVRNVWGTWNWVEMWISADCVSNDVILLLMVKTRVSIKRFMYRGTTISWRHVLLIVNTINQCEVAIDKIVRNHIKYCWLM